MSYQKGHTICHNKQATSYAMTKGPHHMLYKELSQNGHIIYYIKKGHLIYHDKKATPCVIPKEHTMCHTERTQYMSYKGHTTCHTKDHIICYTEWVKSYGMANRTHHLIPQGPHHMSYKRTHHV